MRPHTETRSLLGIMVLAAIAVLIWLTITSRLSFAAAVAIGTVGILAFGVLDFAIVVCPNCGRSLWGANRSRCRVCGFDLGGD